MDEEKRIIRILCRYKGYLETLRRLSTIRYADNVYITLDEAIELLDEGATLIKIDDIGQKIILTKENVRIVGEMPIIDYDALKPPSSYSFRFIRDLNTGHVSVEYDDEIEPKFSISEFNLAMETNDEETYPIFIDRKDGHMKGVVDNG